MSDTIADLFIRISNARGAENLNIKVPYSSLKVAVLAVMKRQGYIANYNSEKETKSISIDVSGPRQFKKIIRLSKPSRRLYVKSRKIPRPKSGYGTVIMSTPKGVLSGEEARKSNTGGEIICEVF